MSAAASRRLRIEAYQALPGTELVSQLTWLRKTIKRLQRDYFEMRVARNRQRRKVR